MPSGPLKAIIRALTAAGYGGLFMASDGTGRVDAIWRNGQHRTYLEQIVRDRALPDLTRLLASELLYQRSPGYPPLAWRGTLAYLYAQALAITGDPSGPFQISGNQWGFMYRSDAAGVRDDGVLAVHLLASGAEAVPHLARLLDDPNPILYEGSQEATLGRRLGYRVKDAAAYFIGRITGVPVRFHENLADRDAEIGALKAVLKRNTHE
jgi:hypothetical protein